MAAAVVKVWAEPSSHGATVYETVLRSDGSLSCDCPGWIYARKGQRRSCKHTRKHEDEVAAILLAWSQGGKAPAPPAPKPPVPNPKVAQAAQAVAQVANLTPLAAVAAAIAEKQAKRAPAPAPSHRAGEEADRIRHLEL
jgi:hypothetical protein